MNPKANNNQEEEQIDTTTRRGRIMGNTAMNAYEVLSLSSDEEVKQDTDGNIVLPQVQYTSQVDAEYKEDIEFNNKLKEIEALDQWDYDLGSFIEIENILDRDYNENDEQCKDTGLTEGDIIHFFMTRIDSQWFLQFEKVVNNPSIMPWIKDQDPMEYLEQMEYIGITTPTKKITELFNFIIEGLLVTYAPVSFLSDSVFDLLVRHDDPRKQPIRLFSKKSRDILTDMDLHHILKMIQKATKFLILLTAKNMFNAVCFDIPCGCPVTYVEHAVVQYALQLLNSKVIASFYDLNRINVIPIIREIREDINLFLNITDIQGTEVTESVMFDLYRMMRTHSIPNYIMEGTQLYIHQYNQLYVNGYTKLETEQRDMMRIRPLVDSVGSNHRAVYLPCPNFTFQYVRACDLQTNSCPICANDFYLGRTLEADQAQDLQIKQYIERYKRRQNNS